MREREENNGSYCSAIPEEEITGTRSDLEKEKINISSSSSLLRVVRQVKKLYLTARSVSIELIKIWKK